VYREEGKVVRTPATIRVTPEQHHIRLHLPTRVSHIVEQFRAAELRQMHGRLPLERDLPGRRAKVNPRQLWQPVGDLRVNPGDRLVVVASGQWTIGAKGEACGPEGYDRGDPRYKHYYDGAGAPARLATDANYGAVLVRIGLAGTLTAVGAETGFTARAGGLVMLDVNEGGAAELRKDNRGQMDVKVIVIPKGEH
jgi:hypothetical protein